MTYDMESTALVLIQHNPAPALQDDQPQAAPTLALPEHRAERMRDVAEKAKSGNTHKAYKTQQGLYEMWARAKGVVPVRPA
jgi:hypothetical protein